MGATLSSMNAALKRQHTPDALVEQLFQGNEWLDMLEQGSQYKIGELARVVIHKSRNGGTTFLPDGGGTLNTAGNQGIDKAEFTYKHLHQQIAIQEDVLEQTSSNALAVAQVLDVEVSGALNDLRKTLTRTLFGNGDSLICGVQTGNSTTITLAVPDGYNAVQRGWLGNGIPVDVGTTASEASIVDNQVITSVTESATVPAIVTATTANVTAGTHFVSLANARSGTTSYEPNGLRNVVSTSSTLGGLAAATPYWAAANVDTTSQPLTLSLILQQDQAINQRSGQKGDLILTGLKQRRKFYEQLQQQVRFDSDGSIDAGKDTAPKWNGMNLAAHPDCPNEDLYVLQRKHLFILASRKPFWQNAITGGEILSWIQGTAGYGGKLGYHFNLATDRRNALSRLGGLS